MAGVPQYSKAIKLPTFECADKGLQEALNLLARTIESIQLPDIRMPNGQGTMEWSGKDVLIRPPNNRTAGTIRPWTPTFHADDKVSFSFGTINSVAPTNWNEQFTVGLSEPDTYKFVVLTVTTAGGQVTGAELSLDSEPVTEDAIAVNVPPTEFKYVLGVMWFGGYRMIVEDNLQSLATVVFLEQKETVEVGKSPFDRWYRWWTSAGDLTTQEEII